MHEWVWVGCVVGVIRVEADVGIEVGVKIGDGVGEGSEVKVGGMGVSVGKCGLVGSGALVLEAAMFVSSTMIASSKAV